MKLYMDDQMKLSGILSILGPAIVSLFFNCIQKNCSLKKPALLWKIILLAYTILILHFTIFRSSHGNTQSMNLQLFWSYTKWDDLAVRWQVYMNVFLFIPFGFFLTAIFTALKGWSGMNVIIVVLITLVFSVAIELTQYLLSLGLCELDDVFHDTIGGAIGSVYYRALAVLLARIRKKSDE